MDKFKEAIKQQLERGTTQTPAQDEFTDVLSQLLRKKPDSKKEERPARAS